MERPQDLRRVLTEGGDWTIWMLSTREALEKVLDSDYFRNVYKTLHEDDEIIIRGRNASENYRLNLLIRDVDLENAKVTAVPIHMIDLNSGEPIVLIDEELEEQEA